MRRRSGRWRTCCAAPRGPGAYASASSGRRARAPAPSACASALSGRRARAPMRAGRAVLRGPCCRRLGIPGLGTCFSVGCPPRIRILRVAGARGWRHEWAIASQLGRRRRLLYRCLRALCAPEGACGRGHAEERSRGRQVDEEEDAAFVRVAGSAAERARWAPQARPPPAAAPLVCARLGPARNAHALLVAGSGLLATGAPARDSPATGLPLWRMLCRLLPGDLGSQHFPIIP